CAGSNQRPPHGAPDEPGGACNENPSSCPIHRTPPTGINALYSVTIAQWKIRPTWSIRPPQLLYCSTVPLLRSKRTQYGYFRRPIWPEACSTSTSRSALYPATSSDVA